VVGGGGRGGEGGGARVRRAGHAGVLEHSAAEVAVDVGGRCWRRERVN
jgi:hypothetical protein